MTLDRGAIAASSGATPAPCEPAWEARKRALWAMSPRERTDAMRAVRLSMRQCLHWAGQRPAEVPLLNGEFEFLAIATPEIAGDFDPPSRSQRRPPRRT